jgi:ABC-type antimicrobial peptide transport system permease subunit
MFKNYCRIGWRNIIRHPFYSLISIAGLAAGIAFTMIIIAYVWNELQVNNQLKNPDRQYIIQSKLKDPSQGYEMASFGALAKALRESYPNLVANYYRFDGVTSNVSKGEKAFRENLQIGDSTLFTMYGFKLLHGNAATALNEPFSVVITEKMARKYFDKTDVIGESITIENFAGTKHPFAITGVLSNTGRNSVTRLNDENYNQFLIPGSNLAYFGRNMDWNNIYIVQYLELQKGVTPAQLEQPIKQLIKQNVSPQTADDITPYLKTLKDYYFSADNGLVKKMLYALSGIALFILLMAIINFVNMSVSRSASRMREIGVRKVLGGLKTQLILQFLVESVLLVFFATLLALLLYACTKDIFSHILGKEIPAFTDFPVSFIGLPILLIVLIGLLAGIYPAFRLSSLQTVESLKGKFLSVKENVWFRKSLVAFQFGTAIVVFTGALIIARQINYFFSQELGYNKDYMVSAQLPRNWTPEGVRKMETIRRGFATIPQVAGTTLSYEIPDGANAGGIALFPLGANASTAITSQLLMTDEYYAAAYQIPMAAGEFYCQPGSFTDSSKIVINEAQVKALGLKNAQEAIGKQLLFKEGQSPFVVAGVVKDFHFGSMQQAVQPASFLHVGITNQYRYLSFRLKPGNIAAAMEALQKQWAMLLPGAPFEYKFMDETLAHVYRSEIQLKQAADIATVLAVVIVLLGILGLVSLSIQKRTKEIGIRKVLGSSTQSIITLFLKDFLPVLLVAGLVAWPLTWLLMKQWLSEYAYRIDITATPFAMATLVLGAITGLLILLQTIRVALENPVKSLRTE